jgi:hypothetical protein
MALIPKLRVSFPAKFFSRWLGAGGINALPTHHQSPTMATPIPAYDAAELLPQTVAAPMDSNGSHVRSATMGSIHSQGLGPDGLPILDAEALEVDYGEKADKYEEFSGIARGYSAVKDRFFWLNYSASPIDDTLPRMIVCTFISCWTNKSHSLGSHCLYCLLCCKV